MTVSTWSDLLGSHSAEHRVSQAIRTALLLCMSESSVTKDVPKTLVFPFTVSLSAV